jgi:DNA-binding NarL/FixJ family response regulator
MAQVRILLADDHALILDGMRRLVESHYEVVGTADDGATVVENAARLRPELVVLDVGLPILNGIDAGREIRKVLPDTKLVFISMHSEAIYVRKAIEAGASAYVLKTSAPEELFKAIEIARGGGSYFSPGLGQEILGDLVMWPRKPSQHTELTLRQRQILQLIAEGKQNKEKWGSCLSTVDSTGSGC